MEKKDTYRSKKRIHSAFIILLAICLYSPIITIASAQGSTAAYDHTARFYPTQDTYIDQTTPTYNYSNETTLQISNGFGNTSTGWERDTLLCFDVSTLPTYTKISTATLYMYYYDYDSTDPVNRVLSLHQITQTGSNLSNITWNTKPSTTQHNISYARIPSTFGWISWNMTSELQRIIQNPTTNQGWQISDKNPWRHTDIPIIKLKSNETQTVYKPYLEIVYTIPLVVSTNGPYETYTNIPLEYNGTIIDGGTPPYSWHWDFGNGVFSSEQHAYYTYTKAGTYTVLLTVSDNTGAFATATTTATLKENSTEPQLSIQHPKNGFYINNKKIMPLQRQIIIGPIDITADVTSYYPITKVKFLIDNNLQSIDTQSPYQFSWNQKIRWGKHTIKVIAVDSTDASAVEELIVWKIL
jgi:hypothetical protein